MTKKQPLQKILQGILQAENESKQNHERAHSIKPKEKKSQKSRITDSAAHNQIIKK
jgi:hypothetical protein